MYIDRNVSRALSQIVFVGYDGFPGREVRSIGSTQHHPLPLRKIQRVLPHRLVLYKQECLPSTWSFDGLQMLAIKRKNVFLSQFP